MAMPDRIYKLASALLAGAPTIRVEAALIIAEKFIELINAIEEFKRHDQAQTHLDC